MEYYVKIIFPGPEGLEVTGEVVNLNDEEVAAWLKNTMELTTTGCAFSIEDTEGNTWVFPPRLFSQCIVGLVRKWRT